MATPKSPFLIYQDFISPKQCELIINDLGFYTPDYDPDGNPIKMVRHHEKHEEYIWSACQNIIPSIFSHFNSEYQGTEHINFEYLAEGVTSKPYCDNSEYLRKKWVRVHNRDFTGVLFLSDYNKSIPFDNEYEVYGGKLEFPQHGFGFNPERGTLIVFPSGPHFIHGNAPIIAGDLHQIKIHFTAKSPYLYQPADFPGDYKSWFSQISS